MPRVLIAAALMALLPLAAGAETPAVGTHGMVATEQALATQIGLDTISHGGNAIDAAVAVGYALAVVNPCCGNIGGGGFMLIHLAKGRGNTFINFREKAPMRASRDMYLDAHGNVVPRLSLDGWLAAGVPGTVAGLEKARKEYGTEPLAQLIAPAIALARDGFTLGQGDVDILSDATARLAKYPGTAAIFTHGGKPYRVGERLRQPALARTLDLIARDGPDAFYHGPIAREIVAASDAHHGLLTLDDLRDYTAEEMMPVSCAYRGYEILSAPPPSSGGTTLCEILKIVEPFPLEVYGWNSAGSVHDVVEAERFAYTDRNTYLGDPDFVKNPVDRLLSNTYIRSLQEKIGDHAGHSSDVKPGLGPPEQAQTTSYTIVDRDGNAVSVTYTINDDFGAAVMAGDAGFLMNNEMDDFTSKPGVPNLYGLVQGTANAIAPGKRPLSSMAPTIALRDGRAAIVTGSPGGSRIISIVLGVLQNIIDYGMNAQDAVDAARFHHQGEPDTIYAEDDAFTPNTIAALKAMGYTSFSVGGEWGAAQAIVFDPRTGQLQGGSDDRRPAGAALGY